MQITVQSGLKGILSFMIFPLLIGDVKDDDSVKEVREPSYIDSQQILF